MHSKIMCPNSMHTKLVCNGDLGKRKVKFGSKKAIFGVIWGGFEGFEPFLGISHPTHIWERYPKKKRFFLAASLSPVNSRYHEILCWTKDKSSIIT